MNDSVIRLRAFSDEYLKIAAELTAKAGHDKAEQKGDVYQDVARKYPQLAPKNAAHGLAEKKAGFMGAVKGGLRAAGEHLHHHEDAYELGGLGVLGAIGADRLQAHARAGAGASNHDIEKKQLLGESGHAAVDTAGLGMLAAPLAAKKLLGR